MAWVFNRTLGMIYKQEMVDDTATKKLLERAAIHANGENNLTDGWYLC